MVNALSPHFLHSEDGTEFLSRGHGRAELMSLLELHFGKTNKTASAHYTSGLLPPPSNSGLHPCHLQASIPTHRKFFFFSLNSSSKFCFSLLGKSCSSRIWIQGLVHSRQVFYPAQISSFTYRTLAALLCVFFGSCQVQ